MQSETVNPVRYRRSDSLGKRVALGKGWLSDLSQVILG
jgi:hypothetical protein